MLSSWILPLVVTVLLLLFSAVYFVRRSSSFVSSKRSLGPFYLCGPTNSGRTALFYSLIRSCQSDSTPSSTPQTLPSMSHNELIYTNSSSFSFPLLDFASPFLHQLTNQFLTMMPRGIVLLLSPSQKIESQRWFYRIWKEWLHSHERFSFVIAIERSKGENQNNKEENLEEYKKLFQTTVDRQWKIEKSMGNNSNEKSIGDEKIVENFIPENSNIQWEKIQIININMEKKEWKEIVNVLNLVNK
jgi:hypothetical protein